MNTREPVRVVLELDYDVQTISGRIAVNDNPERDFYGWLELIHQLQRATDGESPPNGRPSHGP